jgi:hypothetical protein
LYPYQEASRTELSEQVDVLRSSGVVNIKINSATATQHSDIGGLLAYLKERGMKIAIGSVRLDQVTPESVQGLTLSHRLSVSQHLYRPSPPNGAASLTFGIETASTRLLQLLNKKLIGREIGRHLGALIDAGLHNVGLYVLAGIPTETPDDIAETALLIADVTQRLRRVAGHVYVGVNPLIPTPHTPMQRVSIMSCDEFSAWCDTLSAAVAANLDDAESFGRVHFRAMSLTSLLIETLAMRGDRRVGKVLEAFHASASWDLIDETTVAHELARRALPALSFHRRRIALTAVLPWSLVMVPSLNQEEQAYCQRERVAEGSSCIRER